MKFDIYELSSDNTIKVILTDKLIKALELSNIRKKELANKNNITYSTLWKWLFKRKSIPLIFFKNLKDFYKLDLSKYITHLEGYSDKKQIKIPKTLTEDLAKIIGAHIADGHLRARNTNWHKRRSIHYELVLREEYYSNVQAFCNWFNNCFDYNLKPIKRKNHYEVYLSNKVISIFFNKILEMPYGRKTETIRIPRYIRCSNKKIKIAVLQGLMMFDGSVERKTGYISLVSRSENLVKDSYILLKEIGIEPDYINKKEDKYKRHRLIIRKKQKLKQGLVLFETNTEKFVRLKNYLIKNSKV
ncbi:hypothetical protein J4438_03635 [Candidatus Woesearchaeota archaeon]|nr:hypothetical protein [Candidatus Woesearchaeota archaeon]